MGGRGASSATGATRGRGISGANVAFSAQRRAGKSDEERFAQLGRIMGKTARDAVAYNQGIPGASKYKHDAYYRAQREYSRLREKLAPQPNAGPAYKAERTKTFVNSFGEATTRNITSPGYERAQKRLDKAVLRNMGY